MEEPRESGKVIIGRLATWGLLSGGALTVVAVLAAYLPPRLKLLGLFSLGLGFGAGWVIGKIARQCRVHDHRLLFPVACLLTSAALLAQVGQSYRLWHDSQLQRLAAQSQAAQIFDNAAFGTPPRELGTFDEYLSQRFSPLAQSSWAPLRSVAEWPRWLLGLEVLLGGLAGAIVAARAIRGPYCTACESWHAPQRSVVLGPVKGNRCLTLLTGAGKPVLPNDGRLMLEFSSCRCSHALPAVRCSLQQPGAATQVVADVRPDRETFSQLTDLMDADDAAH